MKVALIHHQLRKRGGMESYLLDLIAEFHRQGDEVDIYTYDLDKTLRLPAGVDVFTIDPSPLFKPFKKRAAFKRIGKLFRQTGRCYDLVLSLTRSDIPGHHICAGTHRGYLAGLGKPFRRNDRHTAHFESRCYRNALSVVAQSKKIARELTTLYGVEEERLEVIYPPIDQRRFNRNHDSERARLRAALGIREGRFAVIFPSTNHEIKGLTPLLEAFRRLPSDQFELVIAGRGIAAGVEQENIRFAGFIDRIEEAYTACDLMALPSYYDAFGLVVIESLACGTPVLVSDQVGAAELVGEEHGIVIDTISADAIHAALLEAQHRQFAISASVVEELGLTRAAHIGRLKGLGAP